MSQVLFVSDPTRYDNKTIDFLVSQQYRISQLI